MSDYTTRPISDRTWLRPDGDRVVSSFKATWKDTLALLVREVFAVQFSGMADPVIEVDVRERDLRIDGGLRADAKAATPAVVVAFESKHGPLIYRCDRYSGGRWYYSGTPMQPWQHNVRAIALTLESLRAVDRYGATSRGEQYRGFKAIGGGTGEAPTGMTISIALSIIGEEIGLRLHPSFDVEKLNRAVRRARAAAHPDVHGGDRQRSDAVDQAAQVLTRAGLIS